jgi:hypothetical protein
MDSCSGKTFQLLRCDPNRPVVRVHNSAVLSDECLDGHRFWRRKREIVKNTAVGDLCHLVFIPSSCFQSLGQRTVSIRAFVSAKFQKIRLLDDACQSQQFSAGSKPLAKHLILLAVVVAELQMFLEVFLRVAQIALCLNRQHATFLAQQVRSSCNEFITMWSSEVRFNGAHEREATASFFTARLTSNVR